MEIPRAMLTSEHGRAAARRSKNKSTKLKPTALACDDIRHIDRFASFTLIELVHDQMQSLKPAKKHHRCKHEGTLESMSWW